MVGRSVFLPKWLLVPGIATFVVSLAAFLGLIRVIGFGGYDLSVYLMGGEAFTQGLPVYDQTIRSDVGTGYFTYPPVTLLLFGPLSHLSHGAVHAIMLVTGIAGIWALVWLTMRMAGFLRGKGMLGVSLAVTGAALWLQPVFDSLDQGQINILLVLMVIADFSLDGRRRWPTGILIGVAAAMKITPGIFIVYLVLTRRYRAALVSAATWVALTGLGFVFARADSVRFWFAGTFLDSSRVASPLTPGSVFNQSLHGVLVRFLGDSAGNVAWYPVALVVAAGGLFVAVRAHHALGALPGVLACAVTGLLVSPLTWHEHWLWIVPVLVWLGAAGFQLHSRTPVVAGALPVIGVVFLMWPQPSGPEGQLGPASILSPARHMWEDEGNRNIVVALAGTAYVSVGVVLLLAGAWGLNRMAKQHRLTELPDHLGEAPAMAGNRAV